MPSTVFKDVIRERMTQTGEKFSEARRAVIAEWEAERNVPLLRELMQPGQVVGVVCGGGMSNWAFVLPGLISAHDDGRPITIADVPSARGLYSPGSPVDMICARGLAGPTRVAELLKGNHDAELAALMTEAAKDMREVPGALTMNDWRKELATRADPPIVFVRDIQTGTPVADRPLVRNGRSDYDLIPDQVDALRELARDTGATFIAAHAMPIEMSDGWRDMVDRCDESILIDYNESNSGMTAVTLRRYKGDRHVDNIAAKVDHHMTSWRYAARFA